MRSTRILSIAATIAAIAPWLTATTAQAADCTATDGSELLSCISQATAGDTVTMAAGDFEISGVTFASVQGTAGDPITIQGTLGSDGSRQSHVIGQSVGSNTIEIQGSSYLVFRDFELSHAAGATGNGVDLIKFSGSGTSHHVTIDNLEVHHCGNVAISSQADEIHDISVRNSHVHDIGGSCFYWGYYEASYERKVHHSEIVGNLLQRCPQSDTSETHYGIQLKSGNHDNVIEDNVLVDVSGTTRAGIIVYHSAPKPIGDPLQGSNVIRGNLLLRSRSEGINAAAGAIIENNIVVDAAGYGIYLQPRAYGGANYYGSLQVRNNTVIQSGAAHAIRWTHAAWENDDEARPSEFTGNLAIVETGDGLRPPSDTATVDANATNGNANGAAGTIVLSDVSLAVVSTTLGDADYLWPVATGPLVDVGVAPAAANDFNHVTRDATPDVGAYEWTATSNPGWTIDEDEFKPAGPGGSGGTGGTGGSAGTGGTGQGGESTGGAGTGNAGATPGSAAEPEDEGGCDCTTGPGVPTGRSWVGLALLALATLRRRRG
jgi:MYXO-CTERM domain-containing protein